MYRLTSERCSGIKSGYWSPAKKEDLIQRLGAYEDTGLEPEEIKEAGKESNTPTAEQMFRNLGYKKAFVCVYRRFNPSGSCYEIVADPKGEFTKTYTGEWGTMRYEFTPEEILACAQLIREMEEYKNEKTI